MKHSIIIGVMGGADAIVEDINNAYRLGGLIANEGWVLLNGGRNVGIMEASAKGATDRNGLTIGILPNDDYIGVSPYIRIPIITGMGNARNCINVLSSNIVVACPGGVGTISEIALALKNLKPVILLDFNVGNIFDSYKKQGLIHGVKTPEETIEKIKSILSSNSL